MGTMPPQVVWLRRCQRCKEEVPAGKGMVHCATTRCCGAQYHYKCWAEHLCEVERKEAERAG